MGPGCASWTFERFSSFSVISAVVDACRHEPITMLRDGTNIAEYHPGRFRLLERLDNLAQFNGCMSLACRRHRDAGVRFSFFVRLQIGGFSWLRVLGIKRKFSTSCAQLLLSSACHDFRRFGGDATESQNCHQSSGDN